MLGMTTQAPKSSILGVDWKAGQNNPLHHTGALSKHLLIVRRGQSFSVQIIFKHPFNSHEHNLIFTTETGEQPEEKRGTRCIFGIPDSVKRSAKAKAVWSAAIEQRVSYPEMGIVAVTITPPANAPVGKYSLRLKHSREEEEELGALVVLYNPWCTDDSVYMPEEADRQEYVMNQHGVIYRGSGNYITALAWDFAQFEEKMVQICLMMLDLSHKHLKDPADDVAARCNPIYVGRIVSAMINSEGDRGVLNGKWSGNYSGGVSPSHWSGSYAILQRWLTIGCHPVKYGQCWVFAGVMCSVLRFLGIPCRVVTNYQSAHDNNRNLTIDVYHPDFGVKYVPTEESVWNFHVWVEAWMTRPDLPPGNDGWQVLDPTPQEESNGVFCCGPAPVTAILNGATDLKYDVPFVFAEVNADCVDWLVKKDGSKKEIYSDTKRVGQNISTKSVGSDKRWNITSFYKHREGTEKERAVFKYAVTRDYTRSHETENSEDQDTNEDNVTENGTAASDGDSSSVTGSTPSTVNGETAGGSLNGTAGNGTAGNGTAGNGTAGNGTAGNGTAGNGTAVNGTAGNGTAGNGTAGNGTAGNGTAGNGTAGNGTAGNGTAGNGTAGNGTAVNGTAGNGTTGNGTAGNGTAVNGTGSATNIIKMADVETRSSLPALPQVTMRFEEVSKPLNGKDVKVNLVLHSEALVSRPLSINISVTAMSYNGTPLSTIQSELKQETLLPGKDLSVPVVVPFSTYWEPMLDSDVMKITTLVSDSATPNLMFLAVSDVVLLDPPVDIKLLNEVRVWRAAVLEVSFSNPVEETLRECSFTLSGSGLWREEQRISLPDVGPNNRVKVSLWFYPYKTGQHTLVADFDCSMFRDVKSSITVHVKDTMLYRY
ncbi:protein-glutamine gamma-glutamyltransferase E-like [Eucyclogobius newberryi]|uniref:protein-glutamine gamma-glutamyltransferase E-like n=1 Tax=Eucyclogobius newberryi TaxID=166745 RepID=UPI003B5A7982